MGNLYEIDEKLYYLIEEGFNPETGEVLNQKELNQAINKTTMELDKKIDNIGVYIKNLEAEVEAIKEEKKNLQARQKTKENKINSLKKYLDGYFRYSQSNYFEDKTGKVKFRKFESPRCVISYRKSDSVNITDINKIPKEYIKDRVITENDIDKTCIKDYLKKHENETIDGAELLHNRNISIK